MEDFRSIIQVLVFGIPPGLLVGASYPPPEPLLVSNVAWPNQLIMLRRTGWSQNHRVVGYGNCSSIVTVIDYCMGSSGCVTVGN